MAKDIKMDLNEILNNTAAFLGVTAIVALEEMIKHPIGTVASLVGLLYMYDRWRTQRITRKREQIKLDKDERSIRASEKRKEGT